MNGDSNRLEDLHFHRRPERPFSISVKSWEEYAMYIEVEEEFGGLGL